MIRRVDWIRDRRRWSAVVLLVALAGGVWIAASAVPASATTGGRVPSPREGFLAPSFELKRPTGEVIRMDDLRGQVVVVNFWASWCPPCKAEMPDLERAYQAHRKQGLMILGVNGTFQDSQDSAVGFANAQGVTFPVLLDLSGEVDRRYLVRALPTTFFIDRQGIIRRVVVGGPMSEATLTSTVRDLLQAGP
jgi:cytochrome c biogenesis protein CcmG/thiol:disulfide interchange protein DsbE